MRSCLQSKSTCSEFIMKRMWLVDDLPGNFIDWTHFPSQANMSNKIFFNIQRCYKEPGNWNSKCVQPRNHNWLQISLSVRGNLNEDIVDCIIDTICKKVVWRSGWTTLKTWVIIVLYCLMGWLQSCISLYPRHTSLSERFPSATQRLKLLVNLLSGQTFG